MVYALGIDIGATNTRIAVVDAAGKIVEVERLPSRMAEGAPFFEQVGQQAQRLGEKYQARAVGVGTAGQVHRATGTYLPGLYPEAPWVGVPLRDLVAQATGLPTFVDNDCKIHAYAELKLGAGRGYTDFISLTLGTGLGGGIIANGELVHGAKGIAGHMGHISIDPSGPPCPCGNRGCLELYASGTAVARMASRLLDRQVTSPEVFRLAAAGDELALAVLEQMARALGRGLGAMANMFDPQVLILGGSIMQWYPLLEEATLRSFRSSAMTELRDIPILLSPLAGDGGVLGAGLYALDQLEKVER
ncbi:MAG TPA: ROK family protein [Limnochordia bacterium]|nr:ROK family protein [Limnochordia bacterium]